MANPVQTTPEAAPAGSASTGPSTSAASGSTYIAVADPELELVAAAVVKQLAAMPKRKDANDEARLAAMRSFYAARNGAPLWVDGRGLKTAGSNLRAVISEAATWGMDDDELRIEAAAFEGLTTPALKADIEIALTKKALVYANDARGGRVKPEDLSYDIFRETPVKANDVVLGELASTEDVRGYLEGLQPRHEQFALLRKAYVALTAPESETASDGATATAADKRREERGNARAVERLKLNMEMWRWMPVDLGATHIIANVPEFKVRLFKAGKPVFEERIIVGKEHTQTAIFSDEMEHVIFRPLWGVPDSIKVKELLPKLMRGGNPISKQGLRLQDGNRVVDASQINWARTDIRKLTVFQPSGPGNALGNVKFMFPNTHAIYMHDTPSKPLFKEARRAFSHGCVRVRNPDAFAEIVLGTANGWTAEQTAARFARGPENDRVDLDTKIPVHIGYFTAWADPETGEVSYFDDIYRHERHLAFALAGQYGKIVKQKRNTDADYQRIVAENARYAEDNAAPSWFGFGGFGGGYGNGTGNNNKPTSSYGNSYNSAPSGNWAAPGASRRDWRVRAFNSD